MQMPTEDEMYDALETSAIALRWEFPDIYAVVDEILAKPNRRGQHLAEFDTVLEMNECLRCGEFTSNLKFCDKKCYLEHLAFLERRSRSTTCDQCGKIIRFGRREKKFCDVKCLRKHMRKVGKARWKGHKKK